MPTTRQRSSSFFRNYSHAFIENIANKTVVITGTSSGLGEATAKMLTEKRALVVLGAHRTDRIQALADDIMRGPA